MMDQLTADSYKILPSLTQNRTARIRLKGKWETVIEIEKYFKKLLNITVKIFCQRPFLQIDLLFFDLDSARY